MRPRVSARPRCQFSGGRHRRQSTSIVSALPSERITTASGGSTEVALDVFSPLFGPPPSDPGPATVLLVFPRRRLLPNPALDEAVVLALRSTLPYPIVQVNFRFDDTHQHPRPVHDALAAFDWACANLLPARSIRRAGRSDHVGRIATCGELIGGSLATMLSLTECRAGQPGIVAAAISNPMADWVFPQVHGVVPQGKQKSSFSARSDEHSGLTSTELRRARRQLFRKSEHYFDPFASPIHFFRSPSMEVPIEASPAPNPPSMDEDIADLAGFDHEAFDKETTAEEDIPSETPIGQNDNLVTKRKTSRQFPSRRLGLRLPDFHITSGTTSPLADQAEELAQQLRKSVVRQGKARAAVSAGFGHKVFFDHEEDAMEDDEVRAARLKEVADAEDKVQLRLHHGSGLWDDPREGQARIHEMANWLRQRLC